MNPDEKFDLRPGVLTVRAPFDLEEPQADEEAFLDRVDELLKKHGKSATIDLVLAGSLSSTAIALAIAASRKAADKGKALALRVHRRNAMAVRISGLCELMEVELV